MLNTIHIYNLCGNIVDIITYNNFDDLKQDLKSFIRYYDSNVAIQLLINNEFLNNFDNIDMSILSKIDKNTYISIVYINKNELYCSNKNGKAELNFYYRNDKYYYFLDIIIQIYHQESYKIIMETSYKELILKLIDYETKVLERSPKNILDYISIELQNNKNIVLFAIKNNSAALEFASSKLQNDKEVVIESVKQNGMLLRFASKNLQKDKEIVLIAVKNYGFALRYASRALQKNKTIVLAAIKSSPHSLQFANSLLQNNKNIVFEAVKQDGTSLQYASSILQNNKKIIVKAIEEDILALLYISKKIKNNDKIILKAIKNKDSNLKNYIDNIDIKIKLWLNIKK